MASAGTTAATRHGRVAKAHAMPVRRDASAGANLCYGEADIGAGASQMSQDRVQDVRRLLSELGGQMPMSEGEFRYRVEPLRLESEKSVRALIDLLDSGATHR